MGGCLFQGYYLSAVYLSTICFREKRIARAKLRSLGQHPFDEVCGVIDDTKENLITKRAFPDLPLY